MNTSEEKSELRSIKDKLVAILIVTLAVSVAYVIVRDMFPDCTIQYVELEARIERRLNRLNSEVDELDRVVRNVERAVLTTDLVKIQYLETKVEKLESKLKALEESEKENVDE